VLQGVNDTIQDINDTVQQSPVKVSEIGLTYKDTEQTARATIGQGEISVRDNPSIDLSGLNRDPEKAVTDKTSFDIKFNIKPFDILETVAQVSQSAAYESNSMNKFGVSNVIEHEWNKNVVEKVEEKWNKVTGWFSKSTVDVNGEKSAEEKNAAEQQKLSWEQHKKDFAKNINELKNFLFSSK
jgi:hypothetical protein